MASSSLYSGPSEAWEWNVLSPSQTPRQMLLKDWEYSEPGYTDDYYLGDPYALYTSKAAYQTCVGGCSSAFTGVQYITWLPLASRWRASILLDGMSVVLGHYDSEEEAAWAYDEAAVHYLGPSARTNFIDAELASNWASALMDVHHVLQSKTGLVPIKRSFFTDGDGIDLVVPGMSHAEYYARGLDDIGLQRMMQACSVSLVDFSVPWSRHSAKLAGTYMRARQLITASGTAKRVCFANVDCTVHLPLCQRFSAVNFPTIMVIPRGRARAALRDPGVFVEIQGQLEADAQMLDQGLVLVPQHQLSGRAELDGMYAYTGATDIMALVRLAQNLNSLA